MIPGNEAEMEGIRVGWEGRGGEGRGGLVLSASPRGGTRADVGEYGDFVGTLQQISALVVGEMWGLRFFNAQLSGIASVQLRGDWERSVVRSFKGSNRYFTEMIRLVPLTNKKVDIFNFTLCLEADNERVDILKVLY